MSKRRKSSENNILLDEIEKDNNEQSSLKYMKYTDPPHGFLLYGQLTSGDDLVRHDQFINDQLLNGISQLDSGGYNGLPLPYTESKKAKKTGLPSKPHLENLSKYTFPNYNQFYQLGGADAIIIPQHEDGVGMEVQWPLPVKRMIKSLNSTDSNKIGPIQSQDIEGNELELWYRLPRSVYSRKVGLTSILPQIGEQIKMMLTSSQKVLTATIVGIINNAKRPSTGSITISNLNVTKLSETDPSIYFDSIKSKKRQGNIIMDAIF